MTEVRGDVVVLRGFRGDEVAVAMERMTTIPSELDAERRRERRDRLERSGDRNGWEILFAIEAEGRLVGSVQGRSSDTAMPPGVWEIGIELWDEADRGRGLGRESVRLLSRHLFGEEDAIRVQASTDVENAAMRRVLEADRFAFEGVLRGFMPDSDGPPRDYAMYAMTRHDWENAKEPWTRTS